MTALWFATADPGLPEDTGRRRLARSGLLVGINMHWYRQGRVDESKPQTVFKTVGSPPETLDELGGGLGYRRQNGLALNTPFVVSSSMPNPRLRAQEGYFLASAHPDRDNGPMKSLLIDIPQGDPDATRSLFEDTRGRGSPRKLPFVAILIPSRTKAKLRTYLKHTFSRTAKQLFPDYTGFRDHGEW